MVLILLKPDFHFSNLSSYSSTSVNKLDEKKKNIDLKPLTNLRTIVFHDIAAFLGKPRWKNWWPKTTHSLKKKKHNSSSICLHGEGGEMTRGRRSPLMARSVEIAPPGRPPGPSPPRTRGRVVSTFQARLFSA